MSQCNTKKVDREYVECRLYWLQVGPLNWGEIVQGRPTAIYLNLVVTVGSAGLTWLGCSMRSSFQHCFSGNPKKC